MLKKKSKNKKVKEEEIATQEVELAEPDEIEQKKSIGQFLRIHDIDGFFRYNVNPSYIEAKVQKATAKQLLGQRTLPLQFFAIIGIVILISAIAYSIVQGQISESECQKTLAAIAREGARVVTVEGASAKAQAQPQTQLISGGTKLIAGGG